MRGQKISEGEGRTGKQDRGLAASEVGEDGLVSRTVEDFRDVGSYWKLSSLYPPA